MVEHRPPLSRSERAWAGFGVTAFFIGLWGPLCFLQFFAAALLLAFGLAVLLAAGGGLEPQTFPRLYVGSWLALVSLIVVAGLRFSKASRGRPFHWRFILASGASAAMGAFGLVVLLGFEQRLTHLVQVIAYGLCDFILLTVVVLILDTSIRLGRWIWNIGGRSAFGAGIVAGGGPLLAFIGLPLFFLGATAAASTLAPYAEDATYIESLRLGFTKIAALIDKGVRSLPSIEEAQADVSPPARAEDDLAVSTPELVASMGRPRGKRRRRWPPQPAGLDCQRLEQPNFQSCLLLLELSLPDELSPKDRAIRALRASIPAADAEDRASQARDRVCERRCDLAADRERLVPYYMVAAMNAGVDYFREKRGEEFDEGRDTAPGESCRFGPEERLRDELRETITREALQRLGDERRAAELCIFYSVRRAADELGRPRSTMGETCKKLKKAFQCEVQRLVPYYYD